MHPTPLIISQLTNLLSIHRVLTTVQLRNFCLNKTTSERFAKQKVVQESRTSTYLESQSDSVAESDLNVTISEAMRTRDHSEKPCTVLLNCTDMCCYNKHPDQAELYRIK